MQRKRSMWAWDWPADELPAAYKPGIIQKTDTDQYLKIFTLFFNCRIFTIGF